MAGDDKSSMVRSLIEEYSRRDMLEEEKPDIQNAAAISFLGVCFIILREMDIDLVLMSAGVETVSAYVAFCVIDLCPHRPAA